MAVAWFILILVGILAYITLDGYDLGAGVISLFERDHRRRDAIVEQIGTVWDGNETWLVLVGVSLWAGFPLAFGVILPHLYLPLILMLFGLILRGFSVEIISQHEGKAKIGWYRAFGIGSLVAAFCQGFALGGLSQSVTYSGLQYQGTAFGGFSWYAVLTGVTVVIGYVALGYAYLKFHGVGDQAAVRSRGALYSVLAVVGGVLALVTVQATDATWDFSSVARAFAFWGVLVFAAFGAILALVTFRSTEHTFAARAYPFAGLALTVVAVILAFVLGHYPVIVPGMTLQDAAAPNESYGFLLVGIGLNMPLIAYYNWFSQRVLTHRDAAGIPIASGTEK